MSSWAFNICFRNQVVDLVCSLHYKMIYQIVLLNSNVKLYSKFKEIDKIHIVERHQKILQFYYEKFCSSF